MRAKLIVLKTDGVSHLIEFGGRPAIVRDDEIEYIKLFLKHNPNPETIPYAKVGQKVEVVRGPFKGSHGIVERQKGKMRVLLSIGAINQSLALDIEPNDIVKCEGEDTFLNL